MRILLGCELFYPYLHGGGEVFSYNVARNLAKNGHEVHVISPRRSFDSPGKELPEYSQVEGVHVHRVRGEFRYGQGVQSLPYLVRMFLEASRLMFEMKFDVANAQTFRPCVPVFLAALRHNVPFVGTIYDVYSRGRMFGLENWLRFYGRFGVFGWAAENVVLRLPYDGIVTNSDYSRKKILARVRNTPVHVVKCGVDLDDFPGSYPKKVRGRILYLGRLTTYKNIPDLVEAAARIKKDLPNVSLVIAGSGPLESYARSVQSDVGYVRFVRKPGNDMKVRLLREAEVLVSPSSEEGFGIVLLEANASYTPYVCYDIPALRELTSVTRGGLLARNGNVVDLASKILRILGNKRLSKRLGKSGRRNVERGFSWDAVAPGMESAYRESIQNA